MIKLFCILVFNVGISISSFSQDLEPYWTGVEAQFLGGADSMRKFILEKYVYPKEASEKNLQGKVYIRFEVDTTGRINNLKIEKGLANCESCNQEALRVVKLMPNWNPAIEKGKKVKSYFILPITFEITESDSIEEKEDH